MIVSAGGNCDCAVGYVATLYTEISSVIAFAYIRYVLIVGPAVPDYGALGV